MLPTELYVSDKGSDRLPPEREDNEPGASATADPSFGDNNDGSLCFNKATRRSSAELCSLKSNPTGKDSCSQRPNDRHFLHRCRSGR